MLSIRVLMCFSFFLLSIEAFAAPDNIHYFMDRAMKILGGIVAIFIVICTYRYFIKRKGDTSNKNKSPNKYKQQA